MNGEIFMRKVNVALFCLIVFSISTLVWQNISKKDSINSTKVLNQSSEIYSTIDEFWQASLQGNTDQLNTTLTKIPDDYYSMLNKCDEQSGEIAKRLNSKEIGLFQVTKGVGQDERDYEYNEVLRYSAKIKEKKFVSYKILDTTEVGNHAKVKIEYGENDKSRLWVQLFLLNKEKVKWKIFMIASGWYIDSDNNYFAKSNCSE